MTATINLVALANAIEAISVTGLTICDYDEVPDVVDTRAGAYLFPDPINPLVNLVVTNETWGLESAARKDATYDLQYVLAYEQAGAGRGIKDILPGLMAMIADIVEAVTVTELVSSGAITCQVIVRSAGQIQDPSGGQYHGALLTFRVLEFIQ